MGDVDFLSGKIYLVLPTKANPRVYLAIDNQKITRFSFELYNPFSKKAKMLRVLTRFLCVYCNPLAKLVMPKVHVEKSDLIKFLEIKLDRKITSSVYLATAKDKVVVQLQDSKDIVGYLKYPISSIGIQRLLNEQKAIAMLSKLNLVPDIILNDMYKGTPFMILQNLKGTIGHVSQQEYGPILTALKKDRFFKLVDHPRIVDLKKRLFKNGLNDISNILKRIIDESKNNYWEVSEHGDFAPWNLMKTAKGIVPFDFEYFEEHGLEHLDEIKFHFQLENLLNAKKGIELIRAISAKVDIEEFDLIFKVFLIKEILNKQESNQEFNFERTLLNTLEVKTK